MKKNRIMSLLCAGAMVFADAAVPAGYSGLLTEAPSVNAADERIEKTLGDWKYYDYTGMVALSGYTGTATSVTIPSTLDGKTVYRIYPDVFQNNDKVESITIPKTIQLITSDAFLGCTSLKSFQTSPSGLYRYSAGMLYYVTPENSESEYTISTGDWTSSVMSRKKELVYCTKDSAYITVPDGVDTIGAYAFANREKLTHITLPAGIQYIGDHAFDGCTKLRGMSMTTGDAGNSEFNIPFGTIAIGSYAFYNCESIKTVNFPNTLEFIGAQAFKGTSIKSVYTPPSVEILQYGAFNFDITVIGDPTTIEEGEEETENVAADYAANNYAHYTTTSGYQGGGLNDEGVYQIVDADGNVLTIHMNITHDPNNDYDHNYVYTACVPVTCATPGAISGICYCGHTFYQEFPALGHAFTEEVTVPPTCTEDGYTGMKCARCDAVYERGSGLITPGMTTIPDKEIIPATGHSYGTPVYTWSADYTSCTAAAYCEHDNSHVLMDFGTVTSKKDGNTTIYTAVFNNKSFVTQTVKVTEGSTEPDPTTEPDVKPASGDVNGDGEFGVMDVIQIQKWLLGVSGSKLKDWRAAEYNKDGIIDVFDLALMKRALLKSRSK